VAVIEASDLLLTAATATGVGTVAYLAGLRRGRKRVEVVAVGPAERRPEAARIAETDEDEAADARAMASRQQAGVPLAELAEKLGVPFEPIEVRGPAEIAEQIEQAVVEAEAAPEPPSHALPLAEALEVLAEAAPGGQIHVPPELAGIGVWPEADPDPEPATGPEEAWPHDPSYVEATRQAVREAAGSTDEVPTPDAEPPAPAAEVVAGSLADFAGDPELPKPRVLPIVRRAPKPAEPTPAPPSAAEPTPAEPTPAEPTPAEPAPVTPRPVAAERPTRSTPIFAASDDSDAPSPARPPPWRKWNDPAP
jgi:hypothetical protein